MALVNFSPYHMNGQSEHRLVFVFDNVWSPEGAFRYTLWRAYTRDGITGPLHQPDPILKNEDQGTYILIHCSDKLITKRGGTKESIEHWFSEPTIDAFGFEIYDAPSLAWCSIDKTIHGVKTNDVPLNDKDPYLTLDEKLHEHLFIKWIKPLETIDVYGMIEFKADDETEYSIMALGRLQNAIDGEDKTWKHKQSTPYLDLVNNPVYDADRVWSLKFVPITTTGLGATPARPTRNSNGIDDDGTPTWQMPFFDPNIDLTKFPNAVSSLPFEEIGGVQIVQGCYHTDPRSPVNVQIGRVGYWKRHINAHKALQIVCDYAFGEQNWIIDADDSPLSFAVGTPTGTVLKEGGIGAFTYLLNLSLTPWGASLNLVNTPNLSAGSDPSLLHQWVLLPQSVFGLYDLLEPANPERPHPVVTGSWPRRFKSAWEWIQELAYSLGYWVKVSNDDSVSPPRARIQFINKQTSVQPQFTTIVGESSTPTAFPESENGIKITLKDPFLNAEDNAGAIDDWFAWRIGVTEDENTRASVRQSNPYVVPANAQNAAELQTSLALCGPVSGHLIAFNDGPHVILWYSLSLDDTVFPNGGGVGTNFIQRTENYPTLAPLMLDANGLVQPINGGDATHAVLSFSPLIRGQFTYTFANGSTATVICDSLRQLLARFEALRYVKSAFKVNVKYKTINKFTDVTTDTKGKPVNPATFGKQSWKNIQTHYLCQLYEPDGSDGLPPELYYVKELERNFDDWETDAGYLQTTRFNRNFEQGNTLNWQDGSEITGHVVNTYTGGENGGIISSGSGGTTQTNNDTIAIDSANPVTLHDAALTPGKIITVININASNFQAIQFISGQGTNTAIAPNQVFTVQSNGIEWVVKHNALPGMFVPAPAAPLHSNSAGIPGMIYFDSANMYICTGPTTWLKFTSGGPF